MSRPLVRPRIGFCAPLYLLLARPAAIDRRSVSDPSTHTLTLDQRINARASDDKITERSVLGPLVTQHVDEPAPFEEAMTNE